MPSLMSEINPEMPRPIRPARLVERTTEVAPQPSVVRRSRPSDGLLIGLTALVGGVLVAVTLGVVGHVLASTAQTPQAFAEAAAYYHEATAWLGVAGLGAALAAFEGRR